MKEFFAQLLKIESELNMLSRKFADISRNYSGDEFPEQNMLAGKLDDLVLAATHETASTIGFYRNTMADMMKFIEFRKRFNQFNDEDLACIIDSTSLSASEKLDLMKKSGMDSPNRLNELCATWNQIFNNRSYAKVKRSLESGSL